MWKLVILALAMALTGCGGGGGSSSSNPVTPPVPSIMSAAGTISINSSYIPSLVLGDFEGNGSQYAVVSGWQANSSATTQVKIYKLNNNGTTVDTTASILGSEFSWSVNYPQVADFNHDGIDDIFFPGFTDGPWAVDTFSVVFISQAGHSHRRVLLDGASWNHGTTLVDANQDGWMDVMNARGEIWVNNRAGGFTYRPRDTGIAVAWSIAGSGICAGDLDGSGAVQVVLTDQMLFHASQFIFKLNANMEPSYQGALPMPVFDKNTIDNAVNRSHDVSCLIRDLNGDGRQDVIVVSYLADSLVTRVSGAQSMVQVYYNLGNYVFSDATDIAMPGYNQNVLASYTPKIIDFNNDGKPDIWLMNTNTEESGNQVWLNDGTGKFSQSRRADFNKLLADHTSLNSLDPGTSGIMLPVKVNGKWNFVIAGTTGLKVSITYANTQWTF